MSLARTGLDQRRASFETAASRPPQDEAFFLNAFKDMSHPEERAGVSRARVSKDAGCRCSPRLERPSLFEDLR